MMHKILFSAVFAVSLVFLPSCRKAASPKQEQKNMGTMNITSDPAGAKVSIYGGVIGETPRLTNPVREDVYIVKVAKPGYKPAWAPVKVVAGQQTEASFKLEPETGTLIIESVPSGAQVKIDGNDSGVTPLIKTGLQLRDEKDPYLISVSLEGYVPAKQIPPAPLTNAHPKKETVIMKKSAGKLELSSDPDRVSIEIDGKPRGSTPLVFECSPGIHTVRFSQNGFDTFEQDVLVELDKTTEVKADLDPLPGSLFVDSDPTGANIVVNGNGPLSYSYTGKTPFRNDSLIAGNYTVQLEMEGYDPMEETITVEKGGAEERTFRLYTNTCSLVLTVNPPGMNVYLDGKFVARTVPDSNSSSRDVSESLRFDELSAGEHTITVSNKYATPSKREKKIKLEKGKTEHVEFEMIWLPDTEIVLKNGSKYRGRLTDEYTEDSEKVLLRQLYGSYREGQKMQIITGSYDRSEIQSFTPIKNSDDKK